MEKVKCIKEVPSKEHVCYSVSVGNIYEVISDSGYDYLIKDDLGEDRYYVYEFFESCGIETEKTFKGSELQFWNCFDGQWQDAIGEYRVKIKPDHSKEIAELERQIEKTSKMEITREEYARILRLDPNFFSLELKQWYKRDFGEEGVLIFFDYLNEKGDIKGYGVNSSEWYDNRQNKYFHYGKLSDTNDWIKATKQEVLEVLIKEAKRRGFKHGCSWGRMTAYDGESYDLKNNTLTLQNGNILKDGIWEKTNNY
jgi:hypothetical protein